MLSPHTAKVTPSMKAADWRTPILLTYLLILTVPVTAAAIICARWEYRKLGKLSLLGLSLLCVMLFLPNLVLEYATKYEMPGTLLDYIGVFVGVAGIALCLVSVIQFRSLPKVMCMKTGKLALSGPYRWSRNPQYLGWFLFLLGFALNDWSLWCLAALLVVAVSLHLLVLVEEEHLYQVFGEQFANFCRNVPRYAGWGRKAKH
jgi:protein-S-isoprenylcysteine O-methyltransferase Ste14